MSACRMSFCCTPTGVPIESNQEEGVREFLMRVGKSRDLFQVQEIYDEEGESVRAQRRSAVEPFSVQFESRSTFHVRPGG